MGLNFQQADLLWMLPLAALPIIIHMLNRLRYKSVKWAAMLFLITATRSSTRRAKLRQFLIMAFRVLVLLLFILALSRPKSGWGGWAFSGAPDTVIILLDRSSIMETEDPGSGTTRRELAIKLVSEAAESYAGESKLVLIENVLRTPRSIRRAGQLTNFNMTSATDTAADIPAMLQSALDYMVETRTGRTEIWIASDMQRSNWNPRSPRWTTLASSITALPHDVSVRVLSVAGDTPDNKSLALSMVSRQQRKDKTEVLLDLSLTRDSSLRESMPLTLHLNSGRTQRYIPLEGETISFNQILPIENSESSGWGFVELPDDYNNHDNQAYFTYRRKQHQSSKILANNATVGKYLTLAAAPAPDLLDQSASETSPTMISSITTDPLSLIVWQSAIPTDSNVVNTLMTFVSEGGTLLCLPPGQAGTGSLLGLRWGETDQALAGKPFAIENWIDNEGPLSNASDGTPLELRNLSIMKRQTILDEVGQDDGKTRHELAHFAADRKPFLAARQHGRGTVYFMATLPLKDWSSLSNGRVLVPVVQRMAYDGGKRLSRTFSADAGDWDPGDETWTPLGTTDPRNPRWDAGVYQNGARLVALNRPTREDERARVSREQLEKAFGNIDVYAFDADTSEDRSLEHEIWKLFLIGALLCMVTEGVLITPPKPTSTTRGTKTS